MNDLYDYAMVFLRLGLGFVFLWTGINKVFFGALPGFLPEFLSNFPYLKVMLPMPLGIIELAVGLLLILGLFTRIVGIISAILILGFTVTVTAGVANGFSIVAMNIGLLGGAIALGICGSKLFSVDGLLWHHE
ncbi:DoxX family protein [Candidatus Woesearchaeota archaeon]|nr:DoxX family protein [Candidatus Woesearchaeota archaeon]MBW3017884.1 DoxX family protein [Candidatus Woesearchaeota archaeon]